MESIFIIAPVAVVAMLVVVVLRNQIDYQRSLATTTIACLRTAAIIVAQALKWRTGGSSACLATASSQFGKRPDQSLASASAVTVIAEVESSTAAEDGHSFAVALYTAVVGSECCLM